MNDIEIWMTIKDFPRYEVSDKGEVRNKKTGRILKQSYNRGYAILQLTDGIQPKMKRVHRLVLEAFCPIENSENYEVNHKDCNTKNNNLNNLEWCTSKENTAYRLSLGHTRAKPTRVEYLTGEIEIYPSIAECAKHFNIDPSTVDDYTKNKLTNKRMIQAIFTYI